MNSTLPRSVLCLHMDLLGSMVPMANQGKKKHKLYSPHGPMGFLTVTHSFKDVDVIPTMLTDRGQVGNLRFFNMYYIISVNYIYY